MWTHMPLGRRVYAIKAKAGHMPTSSRKMGSLRYPLGTVSTQGSSSEIPGHKITSDFMVRGSKLRVILNYFKPIKQIFFLLKYGDLITV